MKNSEFAEKVKVKMERISNEEIKVIIGMYIDELRESLLDNGKVTIKNLGTIRTKVLPPRKINMGGLQQHDGVEIKLNNIVTTKPRVFCKLKLEDEIKSELVLRFDSKKKKEDAVIC